MTKKCYFKVTEKRFAERDATAAGRSLRVYNGFLTAQRQETYWEGDDFVVAPYQRTRRRFPNLRNAKEGDIIEILFE